MSELLLTIVALIGLLSAGFSSLNLFSDNKSLTVFERLGLSYGLGLIFIFLLEAFSSYLRIGFEPLFFTTAILLYSLCSWLINPYYFFKPRMPRLKAKEWFLAALILATVLYVGIQSVLRPVIAWDAWATWYLVGKAFAIAGYIDPSIYLYGHFESPPLVQMLVSYIFTMTNIQNDSYSLSSFFIFYISSLLLLLSYFRKYMSLFYSLLFTFLFSSLPNVIRHAGRFDVGNADLPLAYFFLASCLLLIRYISNYTLTSLILLELFIGFGALIKNEGTPFLVIMQVIILSTLILRDKIKKSHLLILITGFLPAVWWYFFKHVNSISPIYLLSDKPHFERIPTIAFNIIVELVNIQRWNLFWVAFLIVLLVVPWRKAKAKLILIPVALQFCVYFYIYIITSGDKDYITQMHGTLDRLFLHITPIVFLWVAINSYYLFSTFFKKKLV